jgi:N-acyl-phosphatidylethanolamine-hydrolysing phospholipase D
MGFPEPKKCFGRFINPCTGRIRRHVWNTILWWVGYYDEPLRKPPAEFTYPTSAARSVDASLPWAVWLGHSTWWIKWNDIHFLTDPLFGQYCAPMQVSMFKRRHPLPLSLKSLPSFDYILISHNHYDHLDNESVSWLNHTNPESQWIVPQGLKGWFLKRGIRRVKELRWGELHATPSCTIHSVPSQHFSGRHLWDQNRTLWCGYVIECGDKRFYFVGDTGYNSFYFKEIGRKWKGIDLSLIPIGAYIPKRFMQPVHICPDEAVQIHCDVRSRLSLGMHWQTFRLSEELPDLPPYDLYLAMKSRNLPLDTFIPIQPGCWINW